MRPFLVAALVLTAACAPEGTIDIDGPVGDSVPERPAADDDAPDEVPATSEPFLVLADVQLADAGADWQWNPGESGTLSFRLVNVSAEDYMWYPGVTVTADDPRVEPQWADSWLYGIFGRSTTDMQVTVVQREPLPRGTVVTFTLTTTNLSCVQDGSDCVASDVVRFRATVE